MNYPKKIQIETTNFCNLDCYGCLKGNRKKGYMHVETFIKCLFFAEEFGIEEIHLHNWGEPMLHPEIFAMVNAVKENGFTVGFTTNATLLTKMSLGRLKRCGLDKLDISYHCEVNKDKLKQLYEYSKRLGIDTWFRCVVFSKEEFKKLALELVEYDVRFQRGIYFDNNKKRTKPCKAIEKLFVINWDGTIVPCCAMSDNQYTYGNIWEITVPELLHAIVTAAYDCKTCDHCFEIDDDIPVNYKL